VNIEMALATVQETVTVTGASPIIDTTATRVMQNFKQGTGGAGFHFDYSSLEEVFLGTSGQSAEMPQPGVQSQFIAKSAATRSRAKGISTGTTTRCRGRTSRPT